MRDSEIGFVIFLFLVGMVVSFFGGCSYGYNHVREDLFTRKEICYEAQDATAKWKTCYALVEKSEATPSKPESR
jgi:hypothetical protein